MTSPDLSNFDYTLYIQDLEQLFSQLESLPATKRNKKQLEKVVKKYPQLQGKLFRRDELITAYRQMRETPLKWVIRLLQMKPTRTVSGVTPITVLTKPFPCPGKCIFCPNDIRMPKSYLSDEPGAQRAERNYFDPYLQTYNRLQALHNIGHPVDKAELIILGGTWSYYPEAYQIWFIHECFRALNEFGIEDDRTRIVEQYKEMHRKLALVDAEVLTDDPIKNKATMKLHQIKGERMSKSYNQTVSNLYTAPEKKGGFDTYQSKTWDELFAQHFSNETAAVRCVGLVIETRPDNISKEEVIRIRKLGCTKTQIGFQSLQDDVLAKNNRGHDVAATRRAVTLLRQAGFKIHAHWMANLYGSSVKLDQQDYDLLFSDPDFRPDELKIYPCSLIDSAELMQYYKDGRWKPYNHDELLEVLMHCLTNTPEYCRLTRVIRDIPSPDIVVGNKKTNFRQIAQQAIEKADLPMQDIRHREIRSQEVDMTLAELKETWYKTSDGFEVFLQYVISATDAFEKDEVLLGFLRLRLPQQNSFIEELQDAALIREVHVYGQQLELGDDDGAKAQHQGFGTRLLKRAEAVAKENNFELLAVISAVGTREYYRSRGFMDGTLYQFKKIG